jgi:hypothetical protein
METIDDDALKENKAVVGKKISLFEKLKGKIKITESESKRDLIIPEHNHSEDFERYIEKTMDMLDLVTRQQDDRVSFFRLCKQAAAPGTA